MQGVDGERVQYIPFDFHFHSKQRGAQVLAEIAPTVQAVLAQTGIFACPPALPSPDAHRLAAATWVGAPMLRLQLACSHAGEAIFKDPAGQVLHNQFSSAAILCPSSGGVPS